MADILLPPWVNIARVGFRYVDSTGRNVSPYTGISKTASFGGDRLAASIEFTIAGGASAVSRMQQSALIGFLVSLRGKQNRAYLHSQARRRGSFPSSELLLNGTFESSSGWSSTDANLALTFDDRLLRAFRVGVAADYQIRASVVTVTSGAAYVARVMSYARKGVLAHRLQLGTTAGATDIASTAADITSAGMHVLTGIASGTSLHLSILDKIPSRAVGDHVDFSFASLSRCILVNGASQAGSSLNVDALPVSSAGLLLPGDGFEVITTRGSEYKICTAALNSDGSGQGTIYFEPPLRGIPSDNAAVIVEKPMARCIFDGDLPQWSNDPGVFTTASAEFEEAA